jgi:predicted nuclease of restriction endonuclease-like (RecB) superfamily
MGIYNKQVIMVAKITYANQLFKNYDLKIMIMMYVKRGHLDSGDLVFLKNNHYY